MNDTPTITPERAAYDALRARAIEGDYVSEDELHRALGAAVASEERAAHAAAIDAERAKHRASEAEDIKRKRKAGEKRLAELVTALVEAQEITAQAHQTMKSAIQEYDRTVKAQNNAVSALATALRENGYPDRRPRQGAESVHVHETRHFDGMTGAVFFDGVAGHRAETARNAVPRFYHHLKAD